MKSDYHERQEQRRERLENAAERAQANSAAARKRSDELVEGIPFGQPILVGHHSERRHRNAIDKSHNAMRKALDEQNRARRLRGRAASVGKGGVSSDDPEAVAKLQDKLQDLERSQDMMKKANQIIRRKPKNEPTDTKMAELNDLVGQHVAARLFDPDFMGRIGFPDYALQNNNANMRRIKQRIEQLETAESAESAEYERAGVKVVENTEENRLQLFFPGKPDYDTRQTIKRNGFRWARSLGCWQRHLNNSARFAAEQVLKYIQASA